MSLSRISRRAFVGGAGVLAGAVIASCLSGCSKDQVKDGIVYAPNGSEAFQVVGYEGKPETVSIVDSIDGLAVTAVGQGAFEGCETLTSSALGTKVRLIGDRAFAGCPLSAVPTSPALQSIGKGAFEGCVQLTEVRCSAALGSVGTRAFADCGTISLVDLASCYGIGDEAFAQCVALEEVDVRDNLRSIGAGAFEGCESLRRFTSLGTVGTTEVAERAFAGCAALTEVELRGKVAIERDAFVGCDSLTSIIVGPESTIAEGAVPEGCEVVEYKDESKTGEVERVQASNAGTGWTSNVTSKWVPSSGSGTVSGQGESARQDDSDEHDAAGRMGGSAGQDGVAR